MDKGCDISSYQGQVNWDDVKSHVDFAFIRSSFGAPDPGQSARYYIDSQFQRNQVEARRVGIKHGYYHFAYPQYNSVDAEVGQFLGTLGTLQAGEMLALDYEQHVADPVSWCKQWLDQVFAKTNVKAFIYMNLDTLRKYDWSTISSTYPLWLADWDNNPGVVPTNISWSAGLPIKQYGLVDFMHADGDASYVDLTQYGLQTGVDQPQVPGIPATTVSIQIHKFQPFTVNLSPSQKYSDEVKRMQQFLVWKGFMQDPGKAYGYYGPMTQTAVNGYQKRHGITGTSQFGWWYDKTRAVANTEL